jgi:hypothetical protein
MRLKKDLLNFLIGYSPPILLGKCRGDGGVSLMIVYHVDGACH